MFRCPNCGWRFTTADGQPHLPFCSERCQLVDLGAWLSEGRRIPGRTTTDELVQDDTEVPRPLTH